MSSRKSSSPRNSDKFFCESPASSCRRPSPPPNPCRPVVTYATEAQLCALTKVVKDNQCHALDAFRVQEKEIAALGRELTCVRHEAFKKIKELECVVQKQCEFERWARRSIDKLACRVEKNWDRTLRAEANTYGALEITQAEINRNATLGRAAYGALNTDMSFVADTVANMSMAQSSSTAAPAAPSSVATGPLGYMYPPTPMAAGEAIAAQTGNPSLAAAAIGYGTRSPGRYPGYGYPGVGLPGVGAPLLSPYGRAAFGGPLGYGGEFAYGEGCLLGERGWGRRGCSPQRRGCSPPRGRCSPVRGRCSPPRGGRYSPRGPACGSC